MVYIKGSINIYGERTNGKNNNAIRHFALPNKIPYLSPYELRHTFVSIAKNLSEGKIKPLVGHSKNMDTFGTYGHEMNGELKRTATQINILFDGFLKDKS